MSYPKVDPRQEFSNLEEDVLKFWKEEKIFEKSIESRPEDNPYRFYDWPPFVTGTPHHGHLLSSTIKDIIPRYFTMKGKRCERVWGWDCHGLPIEQKVQKKLGLESNKDIEKAWIEKFIKECYNYTRSTSAEWEWYVDHIGRWVDFQNSYKTMDQSYMETVMWVFKQLYDKWMIYEGKRVSLYSTKLETPISNFEVAMDNSYEDTNDPAITIMFDLSINWAEWANTYVLAWTTTPWTLPANMALAANKDIEYVKVKSNDNYYVLAKNRVETVFKWKEFEIWEVIATNKLIWMKYKPLFDYYKWKVDEEKNFKIYHGDFITDNDGTGMAHQAPEFGDVDFELGKTNWLNITDALDSEWRYTWQISEYKWVFYRDANTPIIDKLWDKWVLFAKWSITHRVAICPRSWTFLIHKAQHSWFINIASIKTKLLEKNQNINWFPQNLKNWRFAKWIEAAPDWCISRTRYWATPMPIWIGFDANWEEKDRKIFGSKAEIEQASWQKITDLHRPYIDQIVWEENWLTYKRMPEVLDVWLDSASMPYAQMHYPFENKEKMEAGYPADFIVEYVGQLRAWFYVMHVLWVALFDKQSFNNVITTWMIYGTDGKKMSKSLKNFPDPKEIMVKYWADAMRIYMVNTPLVSGWDISFSEDGIQEVLRKIILPIWNTYYFFTTYANIDNFDHTKLIENKDNMLDRRIVSELNQLIVDIENWLTKYDIQSAVSPIFKFVDNLTNWYIRRSRRRFWKSENDTDKLQAYSTLYEVLTKLCKILAPFAPFITENIYKWLTCRESVHLEYYPEVATKAIDQTLIEQMWKVQKIIKLWLNWRKNRTIKVRQPLSSITIWEELEGFYKDIIMDELNVKQVVVSSDINNAAKKICKPDARKLGPKYGREVQTVIKEWKDGNYKQLDDDKVQIQDYILESDEYEIAFEKTDSKFDIEVWFDIVIALDPQITQDLKLEWYTRDIIRHIQETRKEINYNVDDRIKMIISGDNINAIIQKFGKYIEAETLSTIVEKMCTPDIEKQIEIDDMKIEFKLKKCCGWCSTG